MKERWQRRFVNEDAGREVAGGSEEECDGGGNSTTDATQPDDLDARRVNISS